MNCPFCGHENLAGTDFCESCKEDFTSLDGVKPKNEIARALMEDTIGNIPPRKAVSVPKEASIYEVVQQMNSHHTGCVFIVDSNNLVGITTERDILYKVSQKIDEDLKNLSVSSIMTSNPETLLEEDTIAYALNRMFVGGFRHIPILKDKEIVGLVSVRDILKYIVNKFQ